MGGERAAIIEKDLAQIADMLLINGTLTECPGLVHGKMGIVVFFFHYARYTGNELFADYAMDLFSEMLNQIHVNSPADYSKGLAGMGVGIDYLIRNDFLNAEDDICEDFDGRMFRAVMYDPWPDFSQYDGLTGYGRYWMTRLRYQAPSAPARKCLLRIVGLIEERLSGISPDEQTDVYCFLHDLQKTNSFNVETQCIASLREQLQLADVQSFSRLGNSDVGNIVRMAQQCRYFNHDLHDEIDTALRQIPGLDMEKAPAGMGLFSGYAGEGILRLTALGQMNMLWGNLL